MNDADIDWLTGKAVEGPLRTDSPEGWRDFDDLWLPIDFHPWIGWNVSPPRPSDMLGIALAI